MTQEEVISIKVQDREIPAIRIKGYLFPDDIPVSLHDELEEESLSLSEKLLQIHKIAEPESKATVEDFAEAFWYLESQNILSAYDL